ncbi:sigma 54-interacting transcriptional regulator [Dendrosporobacter sp. 1207_IL3150]|uniref:sigma 54-interacting transcriptional regulator n=1 Tax=Dendrosporobacter sp. 1207_IL3150 TaxID=3084054 RepID=UPI002FDB1498
MYIKKQARIVHSNGVHARVAAMIVQKAFDIEKKWQIRLFLRKSGGIEQAVNLMPLVALKIKQGDIIWVEASGPGADAGTAEMVAFLESDFIMTDAKTINQVDILLQDNAVTSGQIFASMANGLIVTDANDTITVFNPAAARILGLDASSIVGRRAQDVIPGSRLHIVAQTRQAELGCRQITGSSSIITNRTPLIADEIVYGAMAVFEDISAIEAIVDELKAVKELKERLQLVLESVQDGICVVDKNGCITYVNQAYLDLVGQPYEEIIGQDVRYLSPTGTRTMVLTTGKPVVGAIVNKPVGLTVIANVSPIVVDGEVTGVVSVIKNVTEVHKLMDKLSKVSAKAEYLEQELRRAKKPAPFCNFIGNSGKVREILAIAAKAADSAATVLIRGESGTGKELIAEGIHKASSRAAAPFIRVNCAAIPENLLESELFGHEKGAFTGAIRQKPGKFSLADKGTIFLDEIGDLSKAMQAKLLRVLQQKEFSRVGGETVIKVDARIIAATSRNLEKMINDDMFREDLYYRLNVIPIVLPPLRDRIADIPLLVDHFLDKVSTQERKPGRVITGNTLYEMMAYHWPGNVRELENVIEQMVILSEGIYLTAEDLPSYLRDKTDCENSFVKDNCGVNQSTVPNPILRWDEYEKQIISAALQEYSSYNAAAKALGLTHKTVAAKARRYGITKDVSLGKSINLVKTINEKQIT